MAHDVVEKNDSPCPCLSGAVEVEIAAYVGRDAVVSAASAFPRRERYLIVSQGRGGAFGGRIDNQSSIPFEVFGDGVSRMAKKKLLVNAAIGAKPLPSERRKRGRAALVRKEGASLGMADEGKAQHHQSAVVEASSTAARVCRRSRKSIRRAS